MVESVASVRDVEASATESLDQPFAFETLRPDRRLETVLEKEPTIVVRERIDSGDGHRPAAEALSDRGCRAGAKVQPFQ